VGQRWATDSRADPRYRYLSCERVRRFLPAIFSVRQPLKTPPELVTLQLGEPNSETPTPASPPPTKSVIYAALGLPPRGDGRHCCRRIHAQFRSRPRVAPRAGFGEHGASPLATSPEWCAVRLPAPSAALRLPELAAKGQVDESYLLFVGRPAPFEAILLWHAPCSCPYSGCKIAGSDLGVWRLLGWWRRSPDNRLAPSTKAVRLIAGRLLQTH
jgi:hypothetical protein